MLFLPIHRFLRLLLSRIQNSLRLHRLFFPDVRITSVSLVLVLRLFVEVVVPVGFTVFMGSVPDLTEYLFRNFLSFRYSQTGPNDC